MNTFQYYNNRLCVEANWLIDVANVLSLSNYKLLKHRNRLSVARRGCRNTPALVEYDSIPERFKSEIVKLAGDPYESTKQHLFKDYLKHDLIAVEYYNNYTLDNGGALPQDKISLYVANAVILNAIRDVLQNRKEKRSALGGKVGKLWDKLTEIIEKLPQHTYPHNLPTNTRSLRNKFNKYSKEGYESLIHKNFCNSNSEKINPESGKWVIARWANQVDRCANIAQLFKEYNNKASVEGWKLLKEESTLRLFLDQEDNKWLWYGHRFGEQKFKEKFIYQHSTKMPSMRDSLWYSDGTKLNYFFLDANGKVSTFQVYEVMDAFSEVLLGFHISRTEDYEAQYFAYKMAVKVAGHRPYQLGFDNQGGHKKLISGDFLGKLSKISIKAQPYNGKSKSIESAFGRFQKMYLKRDWFFTGQNIDTKSDESKANMEFINANKKSLPSLEEVKATYEKRRQEWNESLHHKTKQPRLEMYLNSHNPEAPEIGLLDMVELFWITREKPVQYTAYGLHFKDKGTEYSYVVNKEGLPDLDFMKRNIDKKFFIKYDPEDMSLIYLYDKTPLGLRFVTEARTKLVTARGKQEQDELDAKFLTKMNALNKIERIKTRDEMDELLESQGATAEQQGLVSPNLKGLESKRKGRKGNKADNTYGKITKTVSNMVPTLDDEDDDTNIYNLM